MKRDITLTGEEITKLVLSVFKGIGKIEDKDTQFLVNGELVSDEHVVLQICTNERIDRYI